MSAEEVGPPMAVALKGWPRLSETFIAQELKALEDRGFAFDIWSLRQPYDDKTHPIHAQVRARLFYLPEYLHEEIWRVLGGFFASLGRPGFWRAFGMFLSDLRRDFSRNRVRRFGQACVMAAEAAPSIRFGYAHFLHTPASVARYMAAIRGIEWGFSAHAKDIWTIPAWEKREKIAACRFGATCTEKGAAHLRAVSGAPGRVDLVYHGLDLSRFPAPPASRPGRDGSDPDDPVRIVSVGRMVPKKGYDDLIAALADLPLALHWRLTHIGGGPMMPELKAAANGQGIGDRIDWLGKRDQTEVIEALREADFFVLASKIAGDGDRDGLPNVLMEAASQRLPAVSTRVSAIPEFIEHEVHGLLVKPGHRGELRDAVDRMARDPAMRLRLGAEARLRLETDFGMETGIDVLAGRLRAALGAAGAA